MYYNILKTIKYRKKYNSSLKKKWFLNIILKNNYFVFNVYKYNLLKNTSSIVKIRNRCIINGKSRSNNSKFRLSRHSFKDLSTNGLLNGIKKK